MIARESYRAELLDGRAAADAIKREVANQVAALTAQHGIKPRLAAVLVGDDPASAVYVRNKIRACEQVGIASEHVPLPAATSTQELLFVVDNLNRDAAVDGILVQLPLPSQMHDATSIEAIDPAKDVDA